MTIEMKRLSKSQNELFREILIGECGMSESLLKQDKRVERLTIESIKNLAEGCILMAYQKCEKEIKEKMARGETF